MFVFLFKSKNLGGYYGDIIKYREVVNKLINRVIEGLFCY